MSCRTSREYVEIPAREEAKKNTEVYLTIIRLAGG